MVGVVGRDCVAGYRVWEKMVSGGVWRYLVVVVGYIYI